jgi:hypothetical protein
MCPVISLWIQPALTATPAVNLRRQSSATMASSAAFIISRKQMTKRNGH